MRAWTVCALTVLAVSLLGAQSPTVTLSVDKRPLPEVLEELAKQTGFEFVPVGEARQRSVTLSVEKASLPTVLRRLRMITGCAFVRSQRTYFAIPLMPAGELLKRLKERSAQFPTHLAAIVTLRERTRWGWQTTSWQLRFEAPNRFVAQAPNLTVWSEGAKTWVWDYRQQVITERSSPLSDWSEGWLGVHAVPAFGHGWDALGDWHPSSVEAATLLHRPCWVLELRRKGSPPKQTTYTYSRIALSNTLIVPYQEPQPVPWEVRCFLDCETLSVLRREVFDPRGLPLRILDAEELAVQREAVVPVKFTMLDGGMSPLAHGEWKLLEVAEPLTLPSPPPTVLHPERMPMQVLLQAERAWADWDNAQDAVRLLEQLLGTTNHPVAHLRAALLFTRMNQPEKAWAVWQKSFKHLLAFPEAIALATELATVLRRNEELEKQLRAAAENGTPTLWLALGQAIAWRNWQQNQETEEPLTWYQRALNHFSAQKELLPDELTIAWEAAQRCFVLAWRHGRLSELLRQAEQWQQTPLAPIAIALQAWIAMERGNEPVALSLLADLQEGFGDCLALQLAMAELAETYGITDVADRVYQKLATGFPLLPEGMRAREHLLRRRMEAGQLEEALRLFLLALPFSRSDWTKCGWAAEVSATATLSLRHSQFANLAEAYRQQRFLPPQGIWLYDLMAHFAESEGNLEEALKLLEQATALAPRQPFWAARWAQQVLETHESWLSGLLDEWAAKERRELAQKNLLRLEEQVAKWRRLHAEQPFFARLFLFLPSLKAAYEENPGVLRRLAREQQLRAQEWLKTAGQQAPDRLLMEALALLNFVGNWLERSADIRSALLRVERLPGEDEHSARHLARLLFIAFNSVQPDHKQLLPLLDRAMESCRDEGERIAVAQNALQTLVRHQLWSEAFRRMHQWLRLPGSDLFRRSLLLGWQTVLAPWVADDNARTLLTTQLTYLPDDAIGWLLRAKALEAMGSTNKAKEAYEFALTKEKADWLWQLYGEAAQQWGDLETAERALTEAVRQHPVWERALLLLQVREARQNPLDERELLRWIGHFGWRWQLLTALAARSDPIQAFHYLRLAERLATFDPTVSRFSLLSLRLALAKAAVAVSQLSVANYWLELLSQPEVPAEIRQEAIALREKVKN